MRLPSAEAREIVLREARSDDGLVLCVRQGDDPGPERMHRLISALRILYDDLEGQDSIDRNLAAALHALRIHVCETVSSSKCSRVWRDEFVALEVYRLAASIESIFEGRWIEWL
jgi:hypothetical protein